MKRNIIMLAAALVVLAFLVGGYFIAVKWESREETQATQDNKDESSASYENTAYLFYDSLDNVVSTRFINGDIDYTIYNEDTPRIEGYSSDLIDSSALLSALQMSTGIISSHEIENADEFSAYGLDNDEKLIIVKLKDGSEKKIIIGNSANFEGEYYATVEGTGKVCTISKHVAGELLKNPADYRIIPSCELDNTSIEAFSVSKGSEKILEIKYDEDYVADNEYQPVSYIMEYPRKGVVASLDAISMFFEQIAPVEIKEIVEEKPQNLSLYGLSEPYTFKMKDMNGEYTIKLGDYAEDNSIYMMLNDINAVFKAECSFYSALKTINADDYIEKFINIFNIKDVTKVVVSGGGEKHTLEIKKKSEDNYEYKLDGKIKVEENFVKIYQKIIAPTATQYVDEEPSGEEKCSLEFTFENGNSKKFTYYVYDERHYIVKADNGLISLVLAQKIDDIFEAMK